MSEVVIVNGKRCEPHISCWKIIRAEKRINKSKIHIFFQTMNIRSKGVNVCPDEKNDEEERFFNDEDRPELFKVINYLPFFRYKYNLSYYRNCECHINGDIGEHEDLKY